MPWSAELQDLRDGLVDALIQRCREEVRERRQITPQTDPCRQLDICEEDLDDVQIGAAARLGLRPPYPGEALIIPSFGPERRCSLEDLAAWLAVNGRPLEKGEH